MVKKAFGIIGILLAMSCSSATDISKEEREGIKKEIPSRFSGVAKNMVGSLDCQEKLIDPVDKGELLLIRSLDGIGAYQVPMGKYGLAPNELLRINCRTGVFLGVEKR